MKSIGKLFKLLCITGLLCMTNAIKSFAQEDYTNYVPGAYSNESTASYWYKTPSTANGTLQYDTWSTRGGKDGTDMTTPIMEVHIDNWAGSLGTQSIRHQLISNLPYGHYRLEMKVRCYAEDGNADPTFSVYLYANGETTPIVADGTDVTYTRGTYNGQVWGLNTASLEFDVDTNGTLDFGLDIYQQDHQNWVAWKNVKLYLLEEYEMPVIPIPDGTPIEAGTYYIRNKATGQFIMAGGHWSTEGILDSHAMETRVIKADDDGNFYLNSGFTNQNNNNTQWGIYSSDNRLYVENGLNSFTFSVISDGNDYYTIQTQNGGYLGSDSSSSLSVSLIDPTVDEAKWEFLTYSQMMEELMDGTSSDATFLITNPRFDRYINNTGWEGDTNFVTSFDSNGNGGGITEQWWNQSFNTYQTLTNLPNGTYQLKCQGFYRWNNRSTNTNQYSARATANQMYAKLYAGTTETSLQNISTEISNIQALGLTATGNGMPFSSEEAAKTFNAGLYNNNSVQVTVTDHTLTFGVRKSQMDGCDWAVFDNFELTLLSLGDNTGWDPNGQQNPDDPYENASPENPIDMTSKITNPNYSNGTSGWSGSPATGGMSSNPCAEKYATTFNVYQTINNLPNGWYRLTAQGFYRYGSYYLEQHKGYNEGGWGQGPSENDANNMYAVYTIPYAIITYKQGIQQTICKMYANNVETPFLSPFDDAYDYNPSSGFADTELGYVPDNMNSASYAFSDGKYPMEILVPVTDGTLKIGMKKSFGYKYDWAIWDNFQLYYLGTQDFQMVESVNISESSLDLTNGESRQLSATVAPAESADQTITWSSSNTSVATVDATGKVKAVGTGTANITAIANGSENKGVSARIAVNVSAADGNLANLIINEIQVSNQDMFLDPSLNYGGYVELYNPTNQGVSLRNYYVSMDASNTLQYRLNTNSGIVPANGYGLIWFDHKDAYDGNVGDHLDMDGGTVYISDSNGNIILQQTYPAAISRTSYARTTDGGEEWKLTAYPTPGASNTESLEFVSEGPDNRLLIPEVSSESKMFDIPFTMNVTIPAGATLYYTLDGSTPSESNGLVSADGVFDISETTILRLRLFKHGLLPSPVKTLSYIYRDKNYMLPVLSLVADPVNLYSDELGIFTTGTNGRSGSGIDFPCNWNMEWDRPAAFNYITADNSESYSQEVNVKRFGGWSRSWYPFNCKLKASSLYENQKYVEYPFFNDNKPHLKHKVLQLRNGGNDLQCRIKDASLQNIIISSGFYLDCQDYMPVHSFINGKYQGMLNLREPSNKHFSLANYGIDTDDVDQMELGGGVTVNAGDITAFNQWKDLSYSAGDADTYEQIKSMVDIDEFINYMAVQIFLGGDDWPGNNCKAFKGHDGKFHIVLFDIDQALRFNAYAFTHITNNSGCPLVRILLNMLQYNAEFRKQFVDSFSIVAGSVFEPTRSLEIINRIAAEMEPALALEGASTEPTAGYVRLLMTTDRRNAMMNGLKSWSYADISSAAAHQMKLSANIDQATLQLNGLDIPTAKFDGTMFSPAIIKASAPEGYTFTGWIDENNNIISTDEEFDISSLGDLTLVATYERMNTADDLFNDIATPIKVNEVSAVNTIFVNEFWERNDWFELYNTTDADINVAGLYVSNDINNPLKYQIPTNDIINTIVPAGGHIIVWADELKAESQIHANFKLENIDNHIVVVTSSDEFVANNEAFYNNHPDLQAFVDGLTYVAHRGDHSVGRYPDGGRDFYRMNKPTIERTNTLTTADEKVGEDVCLMDPDANKFRLDLVTGWNWISHNIHASITPSSLTTHSERIVAEKKEVVRDDVYGMVGSLTTLDAGNLYKVKMSQDDVFEYDGLKCNAGLPISLKTGWNWVGYTVTGAQSLANALCNTFVEEGDCIEGQDGFAQFRNGAWTGTLSQFETGKGYMYKSKNAKTLRFYAPDIRVNFSKRRARELDTRHQQYGINKYAYPNVMGMVAQLEIDGTVADQERFTLLAYNDAECRGMGECIDKLIYITMYGTGGEQLSFRVIDNLDGKIYSVKETYSFTSDILGDMESPRRLTVVLDEDEATGIEYVNQMGENGEITTAKVEGYYSLGGMLISTRAASLNPGLYIVRYVNGKCEKIFVK